jgi:putative ABC transport system ATP-binding protein
MTRDEADARRLAVRLEQVGKTYPGPDGGVRALSGIEVGIPAGAFVAVMGPSGSGKSTFLQCAAGLDRPSTGRVWIGDTEISGLDETRATKLRRARIGFVFQSFNLVESLTVRQNVALPSRLAKRPVDDRLLDETLERVGLLDRAGHRPGELSGGQQQRAAIARALVTRPEVIFGDEPTGALDTVTAREILALLRQCVDEAGQTVVMVTHDPMAAAYADSVLFLADGRLVDRLEGAGAEQIAERITRLGAWSGSREAAA